MNAPMLGPRVFPLVLAVQLLGCGQSSPASNGAVDTPVSASVASSDTFGLLEVELPGDTLTVRFASGVTLVLVDDTVYSDQRVMYTDRGRLPRTRFHMVEVGFWESGVLLLFDTTTGRKNVIDDRPLVAPGGGRLAVASMDLEAGYEPNKLAIYRIDADSLVTLLELDGGTDWGPDSIAWHGNDSLQVIQAFPTEAGPGTYRYGVAWAVREGDRWRFTPATERVDSIR